MILGGKFIDFRATFGATPKKSSLFSHQNGNVGRNLFLASKSIKRVFVLRNKMATVIP